MLTRSLIPVFAVLICASAQAQTSRVAIFVSDLRASDAISHLSPQLSALLAQEIARFDELDVLSADDVRALSSFNAEQQLLGCDAPECFVDIGKKLKVSHLVHGAVANVPGANAAQLTVSLIDVSEAKVESRSEQYVRGEHPQSIITGLRAAALNLLTPVLGELSAAKSLSISPSMLSTLASAERRKPWSVTLGAGAGLPVTGNAVHGLNGFPFGGDLGAHYFPWDALGFGLVLHGRYQRSELSDTIAFFDVQTNEGLFSARRGDAEVISAGASFALSVRAPSGVVVPYARGELGASFLSVALGDLIPERADFPDLLTEEREGDVGLAARLGVGVGAEFFVADPLFVALELAAETDVGAHRGRGFFGGLDKDASAQLYDEAIGFNGGVMVKVRVGLHGTE